MRGLNKHKRLKHGLLGATKYGSQSFNLTMGFSKLEMKIKYDIVEEYLKRHEGQHSSNPLHKQDPYHQYNLDCEVERHRTYLYLADDQGYIKVWDLNQIIIETGLQRADSYVSTKINFMPKRKEHIDVRVLAEPLRLE
jgi:hypothetical protein